MVTCTCHYPLAQVNRVKLLSFSYLMHIVNCSGELWWLVLLSFLPYLIFTMTLFEWRAQRNPLRLFSRLQMKNQSLIFNGHGEDTVLTVFLDREIVTHVVGILHIKPVIMTPFMTKNIWNRSTRCERLCNWRINWTYHTNFSNIWFQSQYIINKPLSYDIPRRSQGSL